MSITATEFDYIRDLVHRESAIVLDSSKTYLVETRLASLARQEQAASVTELVRRLQAHATSPLHTQVVDALTTNETLWFRDVAPFDALRDDLLPELVRSRATERSLTVWSAACSSGQEPYSVALLLRERFPELAAWQVRILASDLSGDMLARAAAGTYTQMEVNRGLPAAYLVKHFSREGTTWQLNADLRRMVTFGRVNLAADWPTIPPCDVILLRNVLIYFDVETKRQVLQRVREVLRPDGYLFLGAAETTMNLDDGFERVRMGSAVCYQLRRSLT